MLIIDGAQGEGGGQILRTSLALAAITGTPVRIERIRAGRPKPGLQRQHLAAVQAAAQVSGGVLEGDQLHSTTLTFRSRGPAAGSFDLDIGSAGSTTLVLQTVLPILLEAEAPSTMTIHGGTLNPMAPPVTFLQRSFLPICEAMGASASLSLHRHGFHPGGGGSVQASIRPRRHSSPLDLCTRGELRGRRLDVLSANLSGSIATREAHRFNDLLSWSADELHEQQIDADGPGNVMIAALDYGRFMAVFTAFGERGKASEQVATDCANDVSRYLDHDAPVCEHLADQLLLPLALGPGGRFRTIRPSGHTLTNAAIIALFLGEVVTFAEGSDGTWIIEVRGARGPSR